MNIKELVNNLIYESQLPTDAFISEMGNLIADLTEIPGNIILWTQPQPGELPHNKYRVKVYKDHGHVATYSIGQTPELLEEFNKYRLAGSEKKEIIKFISKFSSLLISYVDAVITLNQLKFQVKKKNGEKNIDIQEEE